MEARDVVNCIYNHNDETEKELQLRLIRFCEERGGGIRADENEFKYIQNMFPNEKFKTDNYSRNNGLIALSEEGMAGLQLWSEGDLDIIIDEDVILNSVYWSYEDFDAYKESMEELSNDFMVLEEIEDIGYDLSEIDIEDIDDIIEALKDADDFIVRNGNEIFELIA
jgi:hypothetical protein